MFLHPFAATSEVPREVCFDDTGFTVYGGEKPVRASWAQVLEVFAYKDDRLTFDDICVGFRFEEDGSHWWVSEDYVGYEALMDELKKRFPGIRTDWFAEVSSPAFARNRTTLWGAHWSPSPK